MSEQKSRKMDTAIVAALIGLVGTIVTALLASPLLPKLMGADTATPGAPVVVTVVASGEAPMIRREAIVFSNDFESGNASGFAFSNEEWQVAKEKNNSVLEMSGLDPESTFVVFGPNDFGDGYIAFRINYRNMDGTLLNFRGDSDTQTYSLYLAPQSAEITLGFGSAANDWNLEPFENGGVRPFAFNEDVWYEVKLEAEGEQMTVWIDGNKVITSSDSRLQQGGMEFVIQGQSTIWVDDVEVWEYTYESQ